MIKNLINLLITFLLIILIVIIPKLSEKNRFRIALLTQGNINMFLIFVFLLFLVLENYRLAVLVMILFFISEMEKNNTIEGYINFIK